MRYMRSADSIDAASDRMRAGPLDPQTVFLHELVQGTAVFSRQARGQRDVATGLGQEIAQIGFLERLQRPCFGLLECLLVYEVIVDGRIRCRIARGAETNDIVLGEEDFT